MLAAKLIKTAEDHTAALQQAAELMDRDPAPGSSEADELELLAHLIEAYEKRRHPLGFPEPLEAIRFRMEQQGLKPKDLVPQLGSPSRVSEVLHGKRTLTLAMIRRLHQDLGIPVEVLVQESRKPARRRMAAQSRSLSTR